MLYTLRKYLSRVVLVIALILAAPATAIMATWNTLPGESLYPLKRNLEKVTGLILSPSYKASSELEIKLISRRLGETEKTIDKSSSAGLNELVSQAQSARKTVLGTTNVKDKSQNKTKLIAELKNTQLKLQEKKLTLNSNPQGGYQKPTNNTITNVVNVTNIIYQQKEANNDSAEQQNSNNTQTDNQYTETETNEPETTEEIVDEINQAEQEIDDIINDLETNINTYDNGSSLQSLDGPAETPSEPTSNRGESQRGERGGSNNTQSIEHAPEPVITPEPTVSPELTPTPENL